MPYRIAYESPRVVETFNALDVIAAADGFEVYTVGNGSQLPVISIGG